jgi:hypothetical protein
MKDEYRKTDPLLIFIGVVVVIAIIAITIILTGILK